MPGILVVVVELLLQPALALNFEAEQRERGEEAERRRASKALALLMLVVGLVEEGLAKS